MRKFCERTEKILGYIIAGLMMLLVVDVTWQVTSRFILNDPSSFTEEIALFLLLWISMLGASYAYRRGVHLGLDIVVEKLQGSQKFWAEKFADLVCLFFAAVLLIYGGMELVLLNMQLEQTSAAMQIMFWKVYIVIPISGVLFAMFAIERLIHGDPHRMEHEQPVV